MSRPTKALVVLTGSVRQDLPDGAGVRQLERVANRPLLAHVLDQIAETRVMEVGLVVTRETADQVRTVVQDGSAWGLKAGYIVQDESVGPGDAMLAAEGFLDDSKFLLHHGDCVLDDGLASLLETPGVGRLDAFMVVRGQAADRTAAERLNDRAGLPLWLLLEAAAVPAILFGPAILATLRGLRRSWRGQPELSEALEAMLRDGAEVGFQSVTGWRYGGTTDELLRGNRMLLDRLAAGYSRAPLADSTVDGRVVIHRTARVEGSVVRGPTIIGPAARVVDSYLGPYSAIGAGALIEGTEVEDSIIGEWAVLTKLGRRLMGSVIGPGARVSRDFGLSDGLRIAVGARAEIAMS